MGKFIDFQEVKEKHPIMDVMEMLGLDLKQEGKKYRGACPFCEQERTFVVTPDGGKDGLGIAGCFKCETIGDCIGIVAKLNQVRMNEAAHMIVTHFGTVPREVRKPAEPREERANDSQKTLQALDYLQADHASVQALGFEKETAEALGIGYAPKGIMRGLVAIPVRLDGTLAGYVGVTSAKLPKTWHLPKANVVPFKKKA